MDLRHLSAFLALAERLNFSKVAEELGLTQPAISHQIAQLEHELGTKLFLRRTTRGVKLTEAGRVLMEHAARIKGDVTDAKDAVEATINPERGALRVGHTPMHREPCLAAVTSVMRNRRFADMRIRIDEVFSPRIEARVRDGRLDLGLVHSLVPTPGVAHEQLSDAPLRLIVHARHPLATARKRIDALEELTDERFVLTRRGLRSRRTVELYFEQKGFVAKIGAEANTLATVLALVRSGRKLVAVLPIPAPRLLDRQGLVVLQLPDALKQSTFLLWRGSAGDEPRTPAGRAFRTALRRIMGVREASGAPRES